MEVHCLFVVVVVGFFFGGGVLRGIYLFIFKWDMKLIYFMFKMPDSSSSD